MIRCIDFSATEVISKFVGIVRIQGNPDAKTIFEAMNQCAMDYPQTNWYESWQTEPLWCGVVETVYILETWNTHAFKQHYVIHKEVLGVKAAMKRNSYMYTPVFVEETVSKVLEFNSAASVWQVWAIFSETNWSEYKLVQYSKIRWLSLTNRVRNLLSHLNQFVLQEWEIHPIRELYRHWLKTFLLDEINRKLQTPHINIYQT